MESAIHFQVLAAVFGIAFVLGAVVAKTGFCAMGAVSDWVNVGDTGRLRAWLLASAVAIAGLTLLEGAAIVSLPSDMSPPYRTAEFAWLRYVLGGLIFGVGMTIGSGCANKTLVRIGGGNLKSVVVFLAIAVVVWLMLVTQLFNVAFMSWIAPTNIDLSRWQLGGQDLGTIAAALTASDPTYVRVIAGAIVALALGGFALRSAGFRHSPDHVLSGVVVGLAVVSGWYLTAGPMGVDWREFAAFAPEPPSRVTVQSLTFVGPIGDTLRYATAPGQWTLINFGMMAVFGVLAGSLVYSLLARRFRIEWFTSFSDFLRHLLGGVLMGFGGFLAMGCTIGQGVTGASTLSVGSFIALASIIFGSALTMKVQYHLLDEQGLLHALQASFQDLRLLPASRTAR